MRVTSLGAAVAVFLLAGVPAGGASAADEAGSGLLAFTLRANAPGLGLEGLYRDVALTVPEATSTLTTGGVGTGFAALAWPGPVVGNAGTTLLVLNPSVPPQATMLNDPVRAESHSGGTEQADNRTAPGTTMTSTATRTRATAVSALGSPTTLPIGGFGTFHGSTTAELVGATGARVTSSSTVQDLSLAEGVIKVAGVRSTATATSDGVTATSSGSTVVTGMTIGGVAVEVDGQGVRVASQQVPNPVAQQTVNDAIAALGLTALVTSPRVVRSGGRASYDAGALVLVFHQGDADYALTLGRASVDVSATRGDPSLLDDVPLSVPPAGVTTPTTPTAPSLVTAPVAVLGGAPGVQQPAVGPPVEVPLSSGSLLPAAVRAALPGGAPAAVWLAVLGLSALVGGLLTRAPRRLLAVPSTTFCEEQA